MSDLELGPGQATQPIELTLSGLNADLAALLPDQTSEVLNNRLKIWMICFDENWQIIDAPYCIRTAIMDRLQSLWDGDKQTFIVKLFAEPMMAAKHFPPYGALTDISQRQIDLNDRGLERVAIYGGRGGNIVWG